MTASKTKYYFRKKTKLNGSEELSLNASSSTESDDVHKKMEDLRRVTLHIITDPGQSTAINSAFQHLVRCLDSTLDIICVSERFKPFNAKETAANTNIPRFPALAVVLFFKDEFSAEEIDLTNESKNNQSQSFSEETKHCIKPRQSFTEIRSILSQKPWRFHHKVAVSGKLISCDSNQQDYYEFAETTLSPRSNFLTQNAEPSTSKLLSMQAAFPLWGVRKVHYGRQILRFTLFISQENWQDQINLYKLILRADETRLRDDFCFFETFSKDSISVQLGFKKLPMNVKPQSLTSSILQFKVKNIGQLVPLLPYSCEPISELRWRTRDHDSNLILLQINRTNGTTVGTSFVKKVFNDYKNHSEKSARLMSRSTTPISPIFASKFTDDPTLNNAQSTLKSEENMKPNNIKKQITRFDSNGLGDSFICPSLPEKMPLFKTPLYFVPSSHRSSSSSAGSSSGGVPARTLSPNGYLSTASTSRTSTPKPRQRSSTPMQSGRLSATSKSDSSKSSKEEGFYV